MARTSRLLSLVLAAFAVASTQLCFAGPVLSQRRGVARSAEGGKKPFFKPRPAGTSPPPPPKASQISMLDIIYVRKYLAGNQKELQKAINMFSHMDPYMKGRIPTRSWRATPSWGIIGRTTAPSPWPRKRINGPSGPWTMRRRRTLRKPANLWNWLRNVASS